MQTATNPGNGDLTPLHPRSFSSVAEKMFPGENFVPEAIQEYDDEKLSAS